MAIEHRTPANQDYSAPAFFYEYLPPKAPPASGCDWPDELDFPGVRVTLSLPCVASLCVNHEIQPHLVSDAVVFGQKLEKYWGTAADEIIDADGDRISVRRRSVEFRCATLAESEVEARNAEDGARATLHGMQAMRGARLRRREATIAKALASHLSIVPESK